MDRSSNSTAPPRSNIPRPASKLPVPRAAAPPPVLRPAPSSDKLYIPRVRNSASKDTLRPTRNNAIPPPRTQTFSASSEREVLRDTSTSTVIHTPSKAPTIKKSTPVLRSRISYDTFRRPLPEAISFETSAIENGNHDVEGSTADNRTAHLRRARPSLSERTMETLAQLPPSPAVRNRGTSGGSRPSSSSNKDMMQPPTRSISSRPSSSSSQKGDVDFRASTNTFRVPSGTPNRPTTGSSFATPSTAGSAKSSFGSVKRSGQSKLITPGFGSSRSPSPHKLDKLQAIKPGSKTISSRTIKPRASMTNLFQKPPLDKQPIFKDVDFSADKTSPTFSNTSSESAISKGSRSTSASSASTVKKSEKPAAIPKASLTLREQIAKAKAAKRAQVQKVPGARSMSQTEAEVPVIPAETFDFGLSDDPFNQVLEQGGSKGLLRKRVDSARRDGRLNIAAMGLKEIPPEVMNMYDFDSAGSGSWAESVDLTRFVAADNEFEILADEVFPDKDPRESMDDEDSNGNQFAGLETLDFHGNVLHTLPMGLRRLEFLTTLNLSNNKLGIDCFEILSQIPNLKDLKIGNNLLSGPLPDSISELRSLEVLHVQKNTLTLLPPGLVDLVRLRVLDVSENLLEAIPFDILQALPLTEVLASKNKLSGVLIGEGIKEIPHLQVLDVTSNSLTSLCASDAILLPAMHKLNCGANRLTALPDMSSWTSLLTLVADDNNISDLPEGFVTLDKLKNADLTGNNLKSLDDRIGTMTSLDVLRISGNPLREKKFSGMSTDDLKRALKMRMAPPEIAVGLEDEDEDTLIPHNEGNASPTPNSPNRPSSPWQVKAGGILDRSNTQSQSFHPVTAAQVAATNTIRILELHHNLFKEIPNSIAFFANTLTSLNLSHNELTSDTFLKDGLDLPLLKELNLSSNTFNSLTPLTMRFFAPNLEKLDISFNRLTSLPILRTYYPNLRILSVSNNTIRELSPESVKGLRVLDCSSNELNSLNARIGLLGGPGGLETLDVRGNRFRVPRWEVLERGTEATLAWLRDKIPGGEVNGLEENF